MAEPRQRPDFGADTDVSEKRTAEALYFAAIEVHRSCHQGDAESIHHAVAQPRFLAQLATGADRHDAPDEVGQGKSNRAGDAAAAGEPGQVGAVRVGGIGPSDVVKHVEHDADTLLGWAVVAGTTWPGEDHAALLARGLTSFPATWLGARRDEQHHR